MGERIGRIRQVETDFLLLFCLKSVHLDLKNPFESAQSAQSVLPLYHNSICIPQSAIHNPQSPSVNV
jgi:hypothetical protein